ncbi:PDZ domain-containing protein MAGIX [Camelus ferus]|uniref:PDZ domain-containing protein MAGIX n=1 Tax=Camelus ferus TaxID=419612 RepID=A0A8B8SMS9_CAMFR|nr:PDZ domain-containing protein MAGIX [Camelus ferus]
MGKGRERSNNIPWVERGFPRSWETEAAPETERGQALALAPTAWPPCRPPGRGLSPPAGPSARQLLARLDARPLAARAAADVAALVRRAGVSLRLRPKEGQNNEHTVNAYRKESILGKNEPTFYQAYLLQELHFPVCLAPRSPVT